MKQERKQAPEHVQQRIDARLATLRTKPKPVSKEWLEEQYIRQGRDCVQIGAQLGKDPKTIWSWIKHYGIPTRSRGNASSQYWFSPGTNHWEGRHHSAESRAKMSANAKVEGRVPYDPAVGSYMKGRRGAETPNWKGGITPDRQAFYTSDEWKEAVKAVWRRDDATCQRCHLDYRTVDRNAVRFSIHHIISFTVRRLRAEPSNLVLLCWPCHCFVHSKANRDRMFLGEPICQ